MSVLVDTSVWSLALRRRRVQEEHPAVQELARLVRDGQASLLGPVRQELLSGIKHREQFELLRDRLRAFGDTPLEAADFEDAADAGNRCRARGVQGSTIDFLLCAVSLRRDLPLFTTDADFTRFQRVLGFALHEIPERR